MSENVRASSFPSAKAGKRIDALSADTHSPPRSWISGRMPSGVSSSVANVIGSLKRRGPALPGFQVENATDRVDLRYVGMPGDDDVEAGAEIGLQRLQVVQNVDRLTCQTDEFRVGVVASPLATVHVSTNGRDGCDPAKRVDDLGASHVAGMNDVIDARQASLRLGPQQAVRVRNDSILNIISRRSQPRSPKDDRETLSGQHLGPR